MNKNWKTFLQHHGANIIDGTAADFGNSSNEIKAASTSDVIADLSYYSVIEVAGDDAKTFLQGQLSNDIDQLDQNITQLSAYCTPKGRMLAIMRAWKHDNGYLLTLPTTLTETVIPRLRMYVLRSQVSLTPSDDLVHIGLSGENTPQLLQSYFGNIPANINQATVSQNIVITRVHGTHTRFELIGPEADIEKLWAQLDTGVKAIGTHAWHWLNIISGIPEITPAVSEAFVPQMANLDVLDGVNFKKGCYPGQEIVARMKYLGKLKQRMYLARIKSDTVPQSGESLYAPDFKNQPAGKVVSTQLAPDDHYDMLIVAQISSANNGKMMLGSVDGPTLTFSDPPYELPTPEEKT